LSLVLLILGEMVSFFMIKSVINSTVASHPLLWATHQKCLKESHSRWTNEFEKRMTGSKTFSVTMKDCRCSSGNPVFDLLWPRWQSWAEHLSWEGMCLSWPYFPWRTWPSSHRSSSLVAALHTVSKIP
jgi:hypothetical protein